MAIKHGIFVYEKDTPASTPITIESSVQTVIGVAPVWMLDDPGAVTNVPILCSSPTEAMEKLGYVTDFATYTLCQTMYANANLFPVSPIVYINVLDVDTMKKSAETVTLTAPVSTRAVVAKAGVIKKTVTVKQGQTTLTKDTDYTLEYNADGNLVINFIPGSEFDASVAATVSVTCADPSQVTAATIIGSQNTTTGKATGAELIQYVYPRLSVIPSIILAPGFSQIATVGAALSAKAANINGVFKSVAVLDIDTVTAKTYQQVESVKKTAGFTSAYCYPVWPCFKVADSYVFAGSTIAAAVTAYTDARNGGVPSRSPSNKLLGVTGTCLADGTEVILNQDQGTIVNGYGVATAINMGGWRLWGSYTGAYPGADTLPDLKDMWLPVRRMFNWQANTFILAYFDKVDDPLNHVLVESVVDSENIRCAAYAPDAWAGAEITYDRGDNPTADLLKGKIVFRQKIAPYTPAQEIDNILSYDTSLLADSLAGLV